MDTKRYLIAGLLVVLLFAITIYNMQRPSLKLSELIENENIEDLSLTIYYTDPFVLTHIPVPIEGLIDGFAQQVIIISGNDLEKHVELFKQISSDDLISVWEKPEFMHARTYYVLESKKNGLLLEVGMWDSDGNIYVNGIKVKENHVFYDVVMPFLPEDSLKRFKEWINIE